MFFSSRQNSLLFWRQQADVPRENTSCFPRTTLAVNYDADSVRTGFREKKKKRQKNSNTASPQVGGSAMNNNATATRPRDAHRPAAAVILVPSQSARNVRDAAVGVRRTRKKAATGGRVKFQIINT